MGLCPPMQSIQNQEFIILPDGIGKKVSIFSCLFASLKEAQSYEDRKQGAGRPREWSDILMFHLLLFYVYFDKSWRKTMLELEQLFKLASIKLPERTTIIKRTNQLNSKMFDFVEVNRRKTRHKSKIRVAYDSTGISHFISGLYRITKHNKEVKGWFKVHLLVDVDTHLILDFIITTDDVSDSRVLQQMMRRLRQWYKGTVILLCDGAGDFHLAYKLAEKLGIYLVVPPREGARLKKPEGHRANRDYLRDKHIREIEIFGYDFWREKYGYGYRWLAETVFSVMKVSLAERVRAKSWDGVLATIGMLLQATQRLMIACRKFLLFEIFQKQQSFKGIIHQDNKRCLCLRLIRLKIY